VSTVYRQGRVAPYLSFWATSAYLSAQTEQPSLASSRSLLLLSRGGEEGLILRGVVRTMFMDGF